jgi:ribosomal protein S18 acetylase RimI-like enzyme
VKSGGFRLARYLLNLQRPSREENARRLAARGESLDALVIRDATETDIPALAALHVKTWNATYAPMLMNGPSVATRASQWQEAFAHDDGSWFALVVQAADGRLVGFVKGKRQDASTGQLDKIYLLGEYQRLGLGHRLVGHAVRRFVSQGLTAMSAYVDPRNPSNAFFEAIGGTWLREPNGSHNQSWYVWSDLTPVLAKCPTEFVR